MKSIIKRCFGSFFIGGQADDRYTGGSDRVLRMQGKGYKAIASAVGLSRDIVRNYCKANDMEGFGEVAALKMQNRLTDETELESSSNTYEERTDA